MEDDRKTPPIAKDVLKAGESSFQKPKNGAAGMGCYQVPFSCI
jgi:hypothetical protein